MSCITLAEYKGASIAPPLPANDQTPDLQQIPHADPLCRHRALPSATKVQTYDLGCRAWHWV